MLRVQCNQCGKSAYTDDVQDPDGALTCPCCPQPHDHAAAANACVGAGINHAGTECPHSDPVACNVVAPQGEECPGGHCGLGVDGCSVCRPVTITVYNVEMNPAG